MFRRLLSLTQRDLRLITRNYYLAIVVILALLYALVTRFLIPADLSPQPAVVLLDSTGAQAMRQLYERAGGGNVIVAGSADEYDRHLEAANRIGIKVTGSVMPERIEVTYQGWETEKTRRLLEASLQGQVAALTGAMGTAFPVFQRTVLRPGQVAEQPPFNLALVPIFIFSEAVLMGIFLAGALLIAEKEDRTNRAYQVTPAGTAEYLVARSLAMGVLALVFTVLLNLLTTGLAGNWAMILLLVFAGAVVTTIFTLIYAAVFMNLSQFLAGSILAIFVLSLPAGSYFMPAFSPVWMRVLPSYPIIFGLREAYFPSGNPGLVTTALGQLGITALVLVPLAMWALGKQLRGGEA
ncbi:MAG: ABC transporter permease [Bacillota bacterium]|nr:ABC transporter permease [Bacillota bacterium]